MPALPTQPCAQTVVCLCAHFDYAPRLAAAAVMAALPSTLPLFSPKAPATAARATSSTETADIPGGPGGRTSPGGAPAMMPGSRMRAEPPKFLTTAASASALPLT